MPQMIGIFGGTFDPPHIGHLILASEALSQLELSRVLWVLTPDPPHKQGQSITSLKHRLKMLKLTISGEPFFELSKAEIDRPGPHHALDTVKIISKQYPGTDLVYLMGGDSLRDLPSWYQPEQLVSALHSFGVMPRPGASTDLSLLEKTIPGIYSKVHFFDIPLFDISSHEIRLRISSGRPFRYFLTPEVFTYIQKHNLYRIS